MRPINLLPVPYISQLSPDYHALLHNNDCGAACGVMLVRAYNEASEVTVDEFYDRCQPSGDVYLSAGQIVAALAHYGVVSKWTYGIKLHDLFDYLRGERPVIALINYGVLVDAKFSEFTRFRGAHFVTIVGMDTAAIYIHDPYWADCVYADALPVPIDLFMRAWGTCHVQNNPDCCGIVASDRLSDNYMADDTLYRVRVTASKALTMRDGPGPNFRAIGYLKPGDERDIYAENNGWGNIGDERWVKLSYTEVVR